MTMANGLPILEMVKQGKLNNPYLPFYINNFYTNQERIKAMKLYKVFDSLGNYLRTFYTYQQAFTFCYSRGRMDWLIKCK